MESTSKIGIFLKGVLVNSFPIGYTSSINALEFAKIATEETGILHEVVVYEEDLVKKSWTKEFLK